MAVSTSAYYAWVKQPVGSGKHVEARKLEQQAMKIFENSKCTYGSRRLSHELKKAGFPVGRYKAHGLMAKLNLKARYPKRFKATTDSNHNDTISPNSLDRQFNVEKPNQVWAADMSVPQQAAYEMRADPSPSACRGRWQTTVSGTRQKRMS